MFALHTSTIIQLFYIKTDKKKAQRKDRVYTHLQNQIAEQAASRAAKKDKEGERAEEGKYASFHKKRKTTAKEAATAREVTAEAAAACSRAQEALAAARLEGICPRT